MKIGNNGNLVLGPFDESTPCLMIVLMNCQTKLRINHLTAVKSVAILEREGRESVSDKTRSERPAISVNDENNEKVRKLITKDRRLIVRMMAHELHINHEFVEKNMRILRLWQNYFALVHPNFEGEHSWSGQRTPTFLPAPPTSIYSTPMPRGHLQTPMPSPGFEPMSNGIAVCVTNHYTV
ncbi:alpha-2 adrenergic receptor [Trichonephila clavipes]|nr:alpha-2 adrenergic receptor [Trichonephila clavipes]